MVMALLAPSWGRAPNETRFVRVDSGVRDRTDWVASGAGVLAYGSRRSVFVADDLGARARAIPFDPGGAVVDAAFVGRRLFVVLADGGVHELQFGHPEDASRAVPLVPASTEARHLAAMETWLVVAEDGAGLRFLPVSGAQACHQAPAGETGFLSWTSRFTAVTSAGRTVYVALSGGGILEINARDPIHPAAVRSIPHRGPISALAAGASRLYVLGEDGLSIIELAPESAVRSELHPEVRGTAIQVAGRTLRIASGEEGLTTYSDRSPAAQLFEVSANDDFFSPKDLSVAVGDTVRFTNATGMQHNVVSCSPAQIGCAGATAAESFTSGAASGFWAVDHTFIQQGQNPYVCQPHAAFMKGSVTVTGAVGAPPGVPGGAPGSPMLVGKLAPDGSTLSLSWDTTSCSGAAGYQILYGYGYGLPGSTGSGYELAGARCSIGAASPFTWTAVPPAFTGSTGFVYWLMVATDGVAAEGSWGKDSAGVERQGPAVGGGSGECGIAVKSLSNTCPP